MPSQGAYKRGDHPNSRANLSKPWWQPDDPKITARIISMYEECGSVEQVRIRYHMSRPRIRAILREAGVLKERT